MMEYLLDTIPFAIIGVVVTVAIYIVIMQRICVKQQKPKPVEVKPLTCSGCGTDMMSENYGCVKCKRSWCKICIKYCTDKHGPDWVLQDGLSDMCKGCRPEREMSLSKPKCFSCDELIYSRKTSQCKTCYRIFCKKCKYTSLNATNDACILCTALDEKWQRKSSAKAICMSCDNSCDKLYQCGKCMRTYCKYCNYKINNDTCWDCVIVI